MKWPYRNAGWMPPAPVIDIGVGGPRDRPESYRACEALVDSGADMTAVPGALIQNLGLLQVSSVLVGRGLDANNVVEEPVFAAAIQVPVLGVRIMQVLGHPERYALLGRDVLNELAVFLDGPNAECDLR